MTNISPEFEAALQRQGMELTGDQLDALDRYRAALWEWNEKLNLTRHTDYEKFVGRDLVDSAALETFLEPGSRVLDVGTGGGVPGMILAILRPDLEMTVCDSVAKRARAAAAIAEQVGLEIRVVHARAEELLEVEQFDTLVARAVAPLAKLVRWLAPHWSEFGELLVVKGPAWIDERREAREAGLLRRLELRKVASYVAAGSDVQSVVLRIRPRES